jgi:hypothetical protein
VPVSNPVPIAGFSLKRVPKGTQIKTDTHFRERENSTHNITSDVISFGAPIENETVHSQIIGVICVDAAVHYFDSDSQHHRSQFI